MGEPFQPRVIATAAPGDTAGAAQPPGLYSIMSEQIFLCAVPYQCKSVCLFHCKHFSIMAALFLCVVSYQCNNRMSNSI